MVDRTPGAGRTGDLVAGEPPGEGDEDQGQHLTHVREGVGERDDELRVRGAVEALLPVLLEEQLGLEVPVEARWTDATEAPFRRMRVRAKKEIVTLGRPDIRPHECTGRYVPPEQWNALIEDPNVLVIDTRNHYEVEVGSFPRAIDPETDSFRQFPDFATRLAETSKDRPLAMFCTGGIRCEKATALMFELGFEEVYHLQGGILNYLTEMPDTENRWRGECFVFDQRVSVTEALDEGYISVTPLSIESTQPDHLGVAAYVAGPTDER